MQKWILVNLIILAGWWHCQAQPGALDHSFDPGTGADNEVRAIAIQSDHKVLIGGFFNAYNGINVYHIARLMPNGNLDTSFHTSGGANAELRAIAIQSDGRILIGGNFTIYGGRNLNYIARLEIDGSVDTTFNCPASLDGAVRAIAIQTDGKIVIGGAFNTFNGASFSRLARLNSNGSIDNGFNVGSGGNGDIECLSIQPDGKIMIGGAFTFYNSNPCLRIGRVNANGSPDTGFNFLVGGASSTVWALQVIPGTQIMVGGDFTNYNGNTINRFMKVGINGSLAVGFNTGGSGANSTVSAVCVDSNNNIMAAGNFLNYDGNTVNRVIVVDQTGVLVPNFNSGRGADNVIYCGTIEYDNKIFVAGTFRYYDSVPRHGIARLYNCTTPAPGAITGIRTTPCAGSVETYSINAVQGADSYEWSLPAGWSGSSDSTSITAITNGTGGVISVKAFSEHCGYSAAQSDSITVISPPDVPICLVTVDIHSSHNIVIWEKPRTTLIDSFYIYRETATNIYTKIAAIPYDSLSEFDDYAADPNVTSYRYKISTVGHCGVESSKSLFHNTVLLQDLRDGNLRWNVYDIEPAYNPVLYFNIYRDNNGSGNFLFLDSVPGTNTAYTDIAGVNFPNAEYVLDANWLISCTPSRAVNTTRSNIRHIFHTGINDQFLSDLKIYPNPTMAKLFVSLPKGGKNIYFEINNSLGQSIYEKEVDITGSVSDLMIDTGSWAKGIYTLYATEADRHLYRKIVVE